jgi:hypothetical protein
LPAPANPHQTSIIPPASAAVYVTEAAPLSLSS